MIGLGRAECLGCPWSVPAAPPIPPRTGAGGRTGGTASWLAGWGWTQESSAQTPVGGALGAAVPSLAALSLR